MKLTLTIDPRDQVPFPNYWEGFKAAITAAFPGAEFIFDQPARIPFANGSITELVSEGIPPIPGGRNADALSFFQAEIDRTFFACS